MSNTINNRGFGEVYPRFEQQDDSASLNMGTALNALPSLFGRYIRTPGAAYLAAAATITLIATLAILIIGTSLATPAGPFAVAGIAAMVLSCAFPITAMAVRELYRGFIAYAIRNA